jgi:hypothetical protein
VLVKEFDNMLSGLGCDGAVTQIQQARTMGNMAAAISSLRVNTRCAQIEGAVLTLRGEGWIRMIKLKTFWYRVAKGIRDGKDTMDTLGRGPGNEKLRTMFWRQDVLLRAKLCNLPTWVMPWELFGKMRGLCRVEQILTAEDVARSTIMTFRTEQQRNRAVKTDACRMLGIERKRATPVMIYPGNSRHTHCEEWETVVDYWQEPRGLS